MCLLTMLTSGGVIMVTNGEGLMSKMSLKISCFTHIILIDNTVNTGLRVFSESARVTCFHSKRLAPTERLSAPRAWALGVLTWERGGAYPVMHNIRLNLHWFRVSFFWGTREIVKQSMEVCRVHSLIGNHSSPLNEAPHNLSRVTWGTILVLSDDFTFEAVQLCCVAVPIFLPMTQSSKYQLHPSLNETGAAICNFYLSTMSARIIGRGKGHDCSLLVSWW